MTSFRIVIMAVISALLIFGLALPASAQTVSASGRIYNDVTKMWETPDGVPIMGKLKAFQIRNVQTAPIRVRS